MFSFIIPTNNNKETLSVLVQKIVEITWQQKLEWEIILIDDASSDGSQELIRYLQTLYPQINPYFHELPIGYYLSFIEGISYAKGNILGFLDASLPHIVECLPKFKTPLLTGSVDIVVGSRLIRNSIFESSLLNKILLNLTTKLILQQLVPVSDPLSNFIFFKKNVLKSIEYSPQGLSFGLELYVKGNYKSIQEVSFHYTSNDKSSDLLSFDKIGLLFQQLKFLKQYERIKPE